MPASRRGAIAFLCAFLFVLPFTSSVALRLGFLGLALACTLAWVAEVDGGWRAWLPPFRVLLPMFAWGAWCAASIAWSADRAYSLSELRPELLYPFVAFLLFYTLTRGPADLDRWAWSLSAGLAALAVGAGALAIATGAWDPHRWHGDFGAFATHIVLALPLLAWAFLRARNAWARALLAAIAIATLAVASWTDNRIAWVALAAMTVLALALARDSIERHRRIRLALAAALAVAAFVAIFALTLQTRSPRHQATVPGAAAELSSDPRVAIWRYSTTLIAQSPWVGHGFGRGILRDRMRKGVEPGIDNPLHSHGHNTLVNVALQGGLVGLALFAWLAAAVVREMAAGWRAGPPGRHAATLGLVLVAGFAIRNLTDDFLTRQNALLLWSLAGAVLGTLATVPRGAGATSARTPA